MITFDVSYYMILEMLQIKYHMLFASEIYHPQKENANMSLTTLN